MSLGHCPAFHVETLRAASWAEGANICSIVLLSLFFPLCFDLRFQMTVSYLKREIWGWAKDACTGDRGVSSASNSESTTPHFTSAEILYFKTQNEF